MVTDVDSVAAGKKTNEQQHSECKLHLPKRASAGGAENATKVN